MRITATVAAWAALALALAAPAGAQQPRTALVDPFVGTSGTDQGGPIDTFPGADVPFGMLQWSPDTPSQNAGGGYEYKDREITGFSLTHLSGPGCNVFGDFGILPTTGGVSDPANAKQSFSHASESAVPGYYAVTLGTPAIRTELTVTPRSGIGTFAFPPTAQANLLFNVSSNQAGVTDASVRIDSPAQISGSASSGFFCGMADRYTVYFVARFDRPMSSYGTWRGAQVRAGSNSERGAGTGAWATFDTQSQQLLRVKVGLSFVSVEGARANLDREQSGWDFAGVRNRANAQWTTMLGRVDADGGTLGQERTFYTALYHALLHPNLFSDVDGRYRGFDGKVHRVRTGHAEYANFSDWDIYRTQVPLLALLAPGETSDMMQSLVDAAGQEAGWLPRWALANGPTSVMGGDSVDPVIAGAYAFGARDFDANAALRAMVKGASTTAGAPGQGWYVPRWELDDDYLDRGYVVNTHTTSVAPVPNGASETLEYALDDFSIARLARAIGKAKIERLFMGRSANWTTLFDTATGWEAGRDPDGAFMRGASTENGQTGFQEGNAAQYTWMVPHDLQGLIAGMGGRDTANAKLDAFFSEINAGQEKPNAWLGNEVSLGSPWVYLSTGEPWRTQEIVRQAIVTLYGDTPDGIPGNDDLGTMSAWYIWSAIGLYPQNPAVREFVIGSPLFSHVKIDAPAGGPEIEIASPAANAGTPYVRSLRVNGSRAENTWIVLPSRGRLELDFDLVPTPVKAWGSAPENAPPSYGNGHPVFPPSSAAQLSAKARQLPGVPGKTLTYAFAIDNPGNATTIAWRAALPKGWQTPSNGATVPVPSATSVPLTLQIAVPADAAAGYYAVPIRATAPNGATLERLRAVVRVASSANGTHPVAYAENRFGNTITPVDLVTGTAGAEIPAGEEPRDAVLSHDGKRLFVTDRGGNTIAVIDTRAERLIQSVKVGHAPAGIAMAPDGSHLWFVNTDDGTVQSLDANTLVAGKPIAVGPAPRAVAIAPDGARAYVTVGYLNAVVPIDLHTGTALAPIAAGSRPSGIAITPDGARAYVVNTASNDVTPIDLATGRPLSSIMVGVQPMSIAISPDGTLAYVSDYANSTITPIDLRANVARANIVAGGAPYGVTFTADGKTALAIARRDNALVVIDVATGRVSAPILLGNGPYTIAAPRS